MALSHLPIGSTQFVTKAPKRAFAFACAGQKTVILAMFAALAKECPTAQLFGDSGLPIELPALDSVFGTKPIALACVVRTKVVRLPLGSRCCRIGLTGLRRFDGSVRCRTLSVARISTKPPMSDLHNFCPTEKAFHGQKCVRTSQLRFRAKP